MAERHHAPLDRPVILIGLMGAGKSTIGRRLGARLGIPFVDADVEIEKAAGSSIEDMFATHGAQAFRDVLLRRVKRRNDRPLLKQGDPQEILRRHMEERYPIYAEADITIDTADAPHETVVREIIQKIEAFRAATTTGVTDEAT